MATLVAETVAKPVTKINAPVAAPEKPVFENPLHPSVVPVTPAVKNYAWGTVGPQSAVARLFSCGSGTAVNCKTPYAEMWIGTHESTPCPVSIPGTEETTLRTFIQDQVIVVDSDKVAHYANLHKSGLPFLLKVLSVAKPLSIQAHPDLKLASELHARAPKLYKDPNHKPELAVAITPFEAMCGFRPMADIVADIARVPEFADAARRAIADEFVSAVKTGSANPDALRHLFGSLVTRDASDIDASIRALVERLGKMADDEITDRDRLLLRLHSHFPGDVGCFGAYLFAHVHMKPGDSIFINANEPHAYLSGQCVEIMATSDNVVRAGLTPKHKDVDTLVSMLTYSETPIEISEGVKVDEYAIMYAPPVEEFMLVKYSLPVGVRYELQKTVAPTVIIVMSGDGYIQSNDPDTDAQAVLPLSAGSVYYLKAASDLSIMSSSALGAMTADNTAAAPLVFFRAGTNEAAIPSSGSCSLM